MATAQKNLSSYYPADVPSGKGKRIGVVVAEWNEEVTGSLNKGVQETLEKHGVSSDDIITHYVPGTFELTLGAQFLAEYKNLDAVICLGCVIQGETRHFDFICQGVTQGITELNIKFNIPVIFGVLTTENQQQALDRAGGVHGNKGDEAAITALKMIGLHDTLKQ
jgi:6,7-dimethyl-8-ribityllumazine synthase